KEMSVGGHRVKLLIEVQICPPKGACQCGFYLPSCFTIFQPQPEPTRRRHSYAQDGPPSVPVPGISASSICPASTIFHEIPLNGIFKRRLQQVLLWPA